MYFYDMRFSSLSPPVRALWAKSSEEGGHGLLAHMLDVAAVAEEILNREPASTRNWAIQAFGLKQDEVVRWLVALVGLHDFGKAIPGFQSKWEAGRQRCIQAGLSFPSVIDGRPHFAKPSIGDSW
ncbi:CRISPR-associated endonuclease Cas3'' [Achromobacter sp. F4_2707]|uniref:CRISPR-associated endonuclease Cas3'' n=1 Tax=Achromobacter sp. F4_2707 TaxID=3114286 RepID=UPI0039C6CAB7